MGVSFKISKVGRRFRPKPTLGSETPGDDSSEKLNSKESVNAPKIEAALDNGGGDISGFSQPTAPDVPAEHEVSFTLSLYVNGYSIGKPSENEAVQQASFRDVPKLPYDRASENLLSAIEAGRLPGDIFEDIPCKFVDGAVICEVHDYRKHTSDQVSPLISKVRLRMSLENVVKDIPLMIDNSWTYGDLMEVESRILKALQPELCLDPAPRLDRLCKDPVPVKLNLSLLSLRRKRLRQMPEVTVMSHNRIHGKKVCIDRMPDCLEQGAIPGHLITQQGQHNLAAQNLDPNMLAGLRPQTLQDGSNPSLPLVPPQQRCPGTGNLKNMQDQGSNTVGVSGASPRGQDMMISYASDNMNPSVSLHGKRENPEGQMSPMSVFNKRARVVPMVPDGVTQQQLGQRIDGLHGTDMNWKNSLLHQQAMMGRGMQYPGSGIQRFSPQQLEGVMNQDGGSMQFSAPQPGIMRYNAKEEPFQATKIEGSIKSEVPMVGSDTSHLDPRVHSRLQQNAFVRSNFPQASWNNSIGQQTEKDPRKEEHFNRRKSAQSPRLSSGAPHSPLSSKSGEFSSGSMGTHFGPVAAGQRDKAAVTSIPAMGGAQSLASSANNDSMQQRQHQAQMAAKRRTNSVPKTQQVMSGVGSPASVNTVNAPVNASSPSMGTQSLAYQAILDRFSKIEAVAGRYQLNCKKHKVDEYSRRPRSYSPQYLVGFLSNLSNEDIKDEDKPLSKSIMGGSMNTCRARILNFAKMERVMQGNVSSLVPRIRTRLVLSEKPMDGTVAWYHGDIDDGDIFAAEDYLSTLPNTHMADLLAAEFRSLMVKDGYLMEEHIQAKPNRVDVGPSSQQSPVNVFQRSGSAVEMQQCGEAVAGQASGEAAKPGNAGNAPIGSPQGILTNTRMLPPANSQALQMSQGLLSGVSMPMRPQQLEPQQQSLPSSQTQQQNQQSMFSQPQQHLQMQRPSMMLPTNPLSSINTIGQSSGMQPGGQMANKPSPLPLQMLQQQHQLPQQQQSQQPQQSQQQQQQAHMQRKILMGLGSGVGMGMGNMGNSIAGLGGMTNSMSMAGRGMGGAGISSPMPSVSGIGNMGQNPMNLNPASNLNAITQQLRSGGLSQAQAQAAMMARLRMGVVNRGVMGGPQAGMMGMSGGRQMHPGSTSLSMLGQNPPLNRANMNAIQRAAMGAMGPPKLIPGMSLYMNQQQLQQQQHSQQQLQSQHTQQQLQQQQQPQQQLQQQMSQPASQQLPQPQNQMSQQQQQLQQLQQHQLPQPQQPQQLPQQLPQQPQQQQLSQQQLSQSQQQQETASPLQSVLSPPQVGSPSAGLPQQQLQQASPQQMNQRTPMSPQISSGTMHPMNAGNLEACPASPQLSSQTLGSVSSITNSPMELQGAKNNSAGNP